MQIWVGWLRARSSRHLQILKSPTYLPTATLDMSNDSIQLVIDYVIAYGLAPAIAFGSGLVDFTSLDRRRLRQLSPCKVLRIIVFPCFLADRFSYPHSLCHLEVEYITRYISNSHQH